MAETKDVKRMIPKELWRRGRAQAILEDKNMSTWLAEAIELKLKTSKKERRTSSPAAK